MNGVAHGHDMVDSVAKTTTAIAAGSTVTAYTTPFTTVQEIAACIGLLAGVLACVSWVLKIRKQWRER